MSGRIRGQEATVRITIADEFAATYGFFGSLEGSFFKVKDFTTSVRLDQTEEPYLGETSDDLDQQIHGYDYAFTIDELDASAINFLSLIAFKEENSLPRPVITASVTYIYREAQITTPTLPQTVLYIDGILKPAERTIGGRKEYISNAYEGKSKKRKVLVG
jgi:hypothetical protein